MHADSRTVLVSVTALSRTGLTRKMLEINKLMNGRVIFQDLNYITENEKSYWVAWYYKTIKTLEDAEKVLDESIES